MRGTKKFLVIVINIALVLQFSLMGFFYNMQKAEAGSPLSQFSATPADATINAVTDYTVNFTTSFSGPIPSGGKVVVEFQAGFDVSASSCSSWTGFNGTCAATVSGQTVTLTGIIANVVNGSKTVVLSNIKNTGTPGNNYYVNVKTQNSSNSIIINGPTDSLYFSIFSQSQSSTDISGIYYLRGNLPTHYQYSGSIGSGVDIGSITRTAPTTTEARSCSSWVDFYFDENGTYTQTNTINNVYYHTWWKSQNSQLTMGYNVNGSYSNTSPLESVSPAPTAANAITKVNNFNLIAQEQIFSSPQSIVGNALYNFEINMFDSDNYPVIYSAPNQASFIILNLPDFTIPANVTGWQALDSDGDSINNYDELFTYYTNPYNSSTNGDTAINPLWNDGYEITHGMNPNQPHSAPAFSKNIFNQVDGIAAGDNLGASVSAIGDQDGDGKEDILVGAPYASPGGRTAAGAVYIYSSATSEIIKEFDGAVAGDHFGYSVARIGNQDTDSREDLIVGAPGASPGGISGAGSVYVLSYASSVASPVQKFDGSTATGHLGTSVSHISDQGPGSKENILAGAPDIRSAFIYSSTSGNILQTYSSDVTGDSFGASVSAIDDQGNGYDDVLIGAPDSSADAGSVYLYSSSSSTNYLTRIDSTIPSNNFGASVSAIDDQGNGHENILVGAPGGRGVPGTSARSAYIYSPSGTKLQEINMGALNNSFGASVSAIDDQGNGHENILVGAPGVGSAFIYSSTTGSVLKQFDSATAGDNFGWSIASIGDQDGDDGEDVLVGAPNANPDSQTGAGSVYIYLSKGNIANQTWAKGSSKSNAFNLSDYFSNSNNPNETFTYSASNTGLINVAINQSTSAVSLSSPSWWAGSETVTFTATDSISLSSISNQITLEVIGESDSTSPTISITQPLLASTTDSSVVIEGLAADTDSGVASLTINGVAILNPTSFSATANLNIGSNTFTIIATDNAGNSTTKTLTITRTSPASATVDEISSIVSSGNRALAATATVTDNSAGVNRVSIIDSSSSDADGTSLSANSVVDVYTQTPTLKGKTAPYANVTIEIHSNPIIAELTADPEGNWSYTPTELLDFGEHIVRITIKEKDTDKLISENEYKINIVEKAEATAATDSDETGESNNNSSNVWFWIISLLAILGIAFVVVKIVRKK